VRLWHVPNARGKSEHNLLKNAKGRLYYFYSVPCFESIVCRPSCESFTCPSEKSLFV
jgi:hypothetical protein